MARRQSPDREEMAALLALLESDQPTISISRADAEKLANMIRQRLRWGRPKTTEETIEEHFKIGNFVLNLVENGMAPKEAKARAMDAFKKAGKTKVNSAYKIIREFRGLHLNYVRTGRFFPK